MLNNMQQTDHLPKDQLPLVGQNVQPRTTMPVYQKLYKLLFVFVWYIIPDIYKKGPFHLLNKLNHK